ncbi:MAG: linear amide C-N hydrolase [Deltaproteobacteria bacterium]|nr:linear amide C-N hydrolase [Deltaproteobacteria bacterium]
MSVLRRQSMIPPALFLVLFLDLVAPSVSSACTRVLWNDSGMPVLVGRTMDWPESTQPKIWVLPRGTARDGGAPENPAKWTSRYGSLVTSVYDLGSADGVNEKGLAAHLLFLKATDFGPRDAAKPGVLAGKWAQYVLDNFSTVNEALEGLGKIQPVMQEHGGFKSTVHLAIEDASGDSAILEYINGKLEVHHGRQYTVMTNDPSYDQQLAYLKTLDFSHPSSDTPLPGNVKPTDRFARATYFRQLLRPTSDLRVAISAIMSIVRNVSVPFDAPYLSDPRFAVYNTEYRTVIDMNPMVYFWEYSKSPSVLWVEAKNVNFAKGAPVKSLDPTALDLNGEVSGRFQTVAKAPF